MIHFDEHIGPGCQPRIGRLCSTLHRTPTEHAGGGESLEFPQKMHRVTWNCASLEKWNSPFYRIHGTGIFTWAWEKSEGNMKGFIFTPLAKWLDSIWPHFLRKIPTRKPQESQNYWILFCVLDNGTLGSLGRGKKNMMMGHIWWSLQGWHTVTCFVAEISLKWLTSTKFLGCFMKYQGVHAWYFPWFTKGAVTLRCGLARQDQLSDLSFGPMGWCLGVEFFGGIQKKGGGFQTVFGQTIKTSTDLTLKCALGRETFQNMALIYLNLGWSRKTISSSCFSDFFWVLCIDFTNIHLQ